MVETQETLYCDKPVRSDRAFNRCSQQQHQYDRSRRSDSLHYKDELPVFLRTSCGVYCLAVGMQLAAVQQHYSRLATCGPWNCEHTA